MRRVVLGITAGCLVDWLHLRRRGLNMKVAGVFYGPAVGGIVHF